MVFAEESKEKTPVFIKFIYKLTGYFPRKLPKTNEEFEALQTILKTYYGVDDREDTWLTLCGQIHSTPATKIRRSYKGLANACNRLDVNKTARDIKELYIKRLEIKLREATQKLVDDEAKETKERTSESDPTLSIGTLDLQRDLQIM